MINCITPGGDKKPGMDQTIQETYDEDWSNIESKSDHRRPKKLAFKEVRAEKRHEDQKARKPKQPRGRHDQPPPAQ